MLPPIPPQAIWRPPVSQHTVVNHPWARDTLPFARPVTPLPEPPSEPPLPPRPQTPVEVAPSSSQQVPRPISDNDGGNNAATTDQPAAGDGTPTITSVQNAAEMEARNGRPARRVTLSDYSFLQERHDEGTENGHLTTALPRTGGEGHIVTAAPAPIPGPAPTNARIFASLSNTTDPRRRASAEHVREEPTFCLCWNWRVPEWLSSCFFEE